MMKVLSAPPVLSVSFSAAAAVFQKWSFRWRGFTKFGFYDFPQFFWSVDIFGSAIPSMQGHELLFS
jgi:hypothetical protein